MVRLVDLKERIMIHQYLHHFIALPFGIATAFSPVYIRLVHESKVITIKQTNNSNAKTIPRVGSSCLKPGLDHELLGNHI